MKNQTLKAQLESVISRYQKVAYNHHDSFFNKFSSLFNGHGPLGAKRLNEIKQIITTHDASNLDHAVISYYLNCFRTHPGRSKGSDFLFEIGKVLAKHLDINTRKIIDLSPICSSLAPPGEASATFSYDYKTGVFLAIKEKYIATTVNTHSMVRR